MLMVSRSEGALSKWWRSLKVSLVMMMLTTSMMMSCSFSLCELAALRGAKEAGTSSCLPLRAVEVHASEKVFHLLLRHLAILPTSLSDCHQHERHFLVAPRSQGHGRGEFAELA